MLTSTCHRCGEEMSADSEDELVSVAQRHAEGCGVVERHSAKW